jgi:hypothetical protein
MEEAAFDEEGQIHFDDVRKVLLFSFSPPNVYLVLHLTIEVISDLLKYLTLPSRNGSFRYSVQYVSLRKSYLRMILSSVTVHVTVLFISFAWIHL